MDKNVEKNSVKNPQFEKMQRIINIAYKFPITSRFNFKLTASYKLEVCKFDGFSRDLLHLSDSKQ